MKERWEELLWEGRSCLHSLNCPAVWHIIIISMHFVSYFQPNPADGICGPSAASLCCSKSNLRCHTSPTCYSILWIWPRQSHCICSIYTCRTACTKTGRHMCLLFSITGRAISRFWPLGVENHFYLASLRLSAPQPRLETALISCTGSNFKFASHWNG